MLAPSSFPSGESPLQPTRRRLVQLACAATLGGPALARGPGSSLGKSPGDGPLILGQSVPLTGPTAHLGRNYVQGAQLVFDQVNAAGGIGRRAIELRIQDDGYEADRCADNTRRFIREDVFALFGYVGTPTSLAAMPQALEGRRPCVSPCTSRSSSSGPLTAKSCLWSCPNCVPKGCAAWPCCARVTPMAMPGWMGCRGPWPHKAWACWG